MHHARLMGEQRQMSGLPGNDKGGPGHPMGDPASAAKLFAELRDADPQAALRDLSGWLEEAKDISGDRETIRSHILALIQEAGDKHVSKLLAQFVSREPDLRVARGSNWNALNHYLRGLTDALCASARQLLQRADADGALQLAAAAGGARSIHACRMLAKLHLVRYMSVPQDVWLLAYSVHGDAERNDCAAKSVRMHIAQKASTSVTMELLRLLMLQSSSPEMMAAEQIEVADRVIEQLGGDFTLRPRGSADNTFWFDPQGGEPPRRAADKQPDADVRYFGPGLGFDALERLHREQAQMRRATDIKQFGQDISAYVQASAIRHLLLFWGPSNPYTAPARSEATGSLRVIHTYSQIWQQLSQVKSASLEMSLTDDNDVPVQAPETWMLRDTGGSELGAEIPPRSGEWAQSGDVVGVLMQGDDRYCLGLIRSMHAAPGHGIHANIAVLSREPQAVRLRPVVEGGEVDGVSEKAARQFAFNTVRAIILADGSQRRNFLLPPEHWQGGRIYEGTVAGTERRLHSLQLLRRGDDYVRASFEWVSAAQD
jgi:hypothetical protein